jgi:hypothetical protein
VKGGKCKVHWNEDCMLTLWTRLNIMTLPYKVNLGCNGVEHKTGELGDV